MDSKQQLAQLREGIDQVDEQLVKLFGERMEISSRISSVKAQSNMAVTDSGREQQVLERAMQLAPDDLKQDIPAFMRTLIALSKIRQTRELELVSPIDFPDPAPLKTGDAKVACQGFSGSWNEFGALSMFPGSRLQNCPDYESVFEAVRTNEADYGVLPIENTLTGAIGEIYSLLSKHSAYTVGQIWIPVEQCLLAVEGASLSDIDTVFSDSEGFSQAKRFLGAKEWELASCLDTTCAVELVAGEEKNNYAAIGPKHAAEAFGLSILAENITDNPNNMTRYIAIAAKPSYSEESNIISVTFSIANRPGSLCAVLESFMLSGINLSRIESRQVSADRYRFFADLEASLLSEAALSGLSRAAVQCEYFEILGCYHTFGEL
ncbi:MAG: chorismate mutase [Eubacteriaceae bacterium]|nr:chorismate mutase [Eubacteriaceae bacterium]